MNWASSLLSASTIVLLSACGGGGSSTTPVNNNPLTNTVSWVAGEFQSSTTYKDYCEIPRSDSNYADKTGTEMHEKMWLRSWSDENYLWYNEIADTDPAPYSVLSYFDILKTMEQTSSGKEKDEFHFTYDTAVWEQLTQSGITVDYGVEWAYISLSPPRELRVSFTEHNSPASSENIARGDELIEIDGIDFVNAGDQASVDQLNAALFPDAENESHSFTFKKFASNETYQVTMQAQAIQTSPVYNTKVIPTSTGNVAYMQFNSFIGPAEKPLIDAFNNFSEQGVTDLVLDLRYNGGGLLYMASQLAYMISGSENTNNDDFYRFQYNNKRSNSTVPFWPTTINWAENITEGAPLPSLNLNRVYVLTTNGTCSASEAVMNGLLGSDVEVIQIGDTTCGKPYGFSGTDNCSTTYFSIEFQGVNDKGFGDYADGFSPINSVGLTNPDTLIEGCSVADDFANALSSTSEALLASALSYRESSSCPSEVSSFNTSAKSMLNTVESIKDPRIQKHLKNNLFFNKG